MAEQLTTTAVHGRFELAPLPFDHVRADYGLFGPGSATWQVWGHNLGTVLMATPRAAIAQMFHPPTAAGVSQYSVYQQDPLGRSKGTGAYFFTVVFGDTPTVVAASAQLQRVHARVSGTEPISGAPYQANDPASQLYVHMTTWHSVLKQYEAYGPGPLSPDREASFWAECRKAAQLQTCSIDDVPTSREEVREYFAAIRPRLAITEPALDTVRWLMAPQIPGTAIFKPAIPIATAAAVATLPQYMRQLAGIEAPLLARGAIKPAAKLICAAVNFAPRAAERYVGELLSPTGYAARELMLRGPKPHDPSVVTTEELRDRIQQHREALRAVRPS